MKVHVKIHLEALPDYLFGLQRIDSTLWVVAHFGLKIESDHIQMNLQMKLHVNPHVKKKVHLKLHMNLHMKVFFI